MKVMLCLLVLSTLAIFVDAQRNSEELRIRRESAVTDCSRNLKNLFLISCAREHKQALRTARGRKSIIKKLGSLVDECCEQECTPDVVFNYC